VFSPLSLCHSACSTLISGAAFDRPKRCWASLSIALVTLFCQPFFDSVSPSARGAEPEAIARFQKEIKPILTQYCIGCHNAELKKGDIAFDQVDGDPAMLENRVLWWKTLKMVRAGIMPPKNKPHPGLEQIDQLVSWIKTATFKIDPLDPDPGSVTVRRLNRTEYRNTIRDLLGINFDTNAEFPADDTGHGFDNIGEVLTISPLLLEKYVAAARTIIGQTIPPASKVVAEKRIPGKNFKLAGDAKPGPGMGDSLVLSYYKAAGASTVARADHAGHYQLVLDLSANEKYVDGVFDYNKCRLIFKIDGKTVLDQEYTRQGGRPYRYEYPLEWAVGDHELSVELIPLTPKEKQLRTLTMRVVAATVRGPLEKEYWIPPANYQRRFPDPVPTGSSERQVYARRLLERFATKAFRRPVDEATLKRLVQLAESIYSQPGRTFEVGIAQAMTVVLASPRFLFREEDSKQGASGAHPLIDEFSLASRLSYFLWSTMPDDELFKLAASNKLREHLQPQLARMLADPRSGEFVRNFVGQWLQARDIQTVIINARAIISRDEAPDVKADQRRARFRELNSKPPDSLTEAEKKELAEVRGNVFGGFRRFAQFELNDDLRRAMRQETEMLFEHIVKKDASLVELIESDYTFLNERLAKHYGIEGVKGDQMRLVKLPPDSPRGGVLTQGTVLAITSNPDRTSPVKRGLYILDNILGTPPAPPPPDIPALEDALAGHTGKPPTLRETLKMHRGESLCSSCHNRMDPLGLAFENFNALGRFRAKERDQEIDASGQLISGESFKNVKELKHILVSQRRLDFYRCLTEKLLTYALGRGLDYYDVEAVDKIVERLEKEKGRPIALLAGIIESAPFQKRRAPVASTIAAQQRTTNDSND
jgi:mono/diheme cytochrome c family protein